MLQILCSIKAVACECTPIQRTQECTYPVCVRPSVYLQWTSSKKGQKTNVTNVTLLLLRGEWMQQHGLQELCTLSVTILRLHMIAY